MRIGILTFHWVANHGAVLQTYATQTYLTNSLNQDVEVINYCSNKVEITLKNAIKGRNVFRIYPKLQNVIKNKRISRFRNNLNLTQRYYSAQELKDNPPDFDLLLCGSDQIWNPSYVMHGEDTPTAVYFLDFGKDNCKKAALSVSFGCTEYPKKALEIVRKNIASLNAISVREKSGIDILEKMGVENAVLTADPTALLSKEQYLEICKNVSVDKKTFIALCILRNQTEVTKAIIRNVLNFYKTKSINIEKMSMENWLAGIRDAKMVLTNSFHCVMMCLKLHTPFAVVLETGALAGMNDRLFTLLKHFDLEDRIIEKYNDDALNNEINWVKIDELMDLYADTLKNYLNGIIGG